MIPLPTRSILAISAVVDVALHARPGPVAARALTARHGQGPRHLETVLQALVRAGILKGVRGPRGGYELARERRRITVADVVRATGGAGAASGLEGAGPIGQAIAPALRQAGEMFLAELDRVTVEELCRRAGHAAGAEADFTI